MGPFIISQFIICGFCLAIGILHLSIYLRMTERKTDLYFSVMSICIGLATLFSVLGYRAQTIDAFTPFYKTQIVFDGFTWMALAGFIAAYTRASRRWLVITVISLYAAAVLISIVSPYGILLLKIESIEQALLPWSERLAYPVGPSNPFRFIADISWFLLIYMAIESCVRMSRRGDKRRAVLLGTCLAVFLGFAYLHGTLLDLGLVGPPTWLNFSFLGLILVMSASMSGEVVQTSVLNLQTREHERRWKSLFENVDLLILSFGSDGRIRYANPYLSKLTGFLPDEIIDKPLTELVPETDRQDMANRFKAAMADELRPNVTRSIITKTGGLRQVRWFNVLLKDSDGRPNGTLNVGEDITKLVSAEQALKDEKERMEIVLSTLNTGLSLINPDMTVAWANDHLRRMLSWDDPIGKKCHVFAENRDEPCDECGAIKSFSDGRIHKRDLLNSTNNKWYHIVSLPIQNETGNVIQVLESVTDITSQKQLLATRDQALEDLKDLKEKIQAENIYLKEEIRGRHGFEEIIGKSKPLLYVLNRIEQVAQTDATVLVQGETGVGKELIAHAIYRKSKRSDRPFLKINCAAIPSELAESELFGHEPGAFTGAVKQRKGRFEIADGGTLFLDEISEISTELQSKLLRILQDGQFERVGNSTTITTDVRVIAATNRDLNEAVKSGRFRLDLFYRLDVYPITMPPLRKRREDIPLLVQHFLPEMSGRIGKLIDQVPPLVMEQLTAYDWPGNVRELKNVLERSVIISSGPVLELGQAFGEMATNIPSGHDADTELEPLKEIERRHIQKALNATDWRISGPRGAAKILGLNPSTLRFRMKKLGIQRNDSNSV